MDRITHWQAVGKDILTLVSWAVPLVAAYFAGISTVKDAPVEKREISDTTCFLMCFAAIWYMIRIAV